VKLQVFGVVGPNDAPADVASGHAPGEWGVSGTAPVADPLSCSHRYPGASRIQRGGGAELARTEQAPAPAFAESRAVDYSLTMLDPLRSPTVAEMAISRAGAGSGSGPAFVLARVWGGACVWPLLCEECAGHAVCDLARPVGADVETGFSAVAGAPYWVRLRPHALSIAVSCLPRLLGLCRGTRRDLITSSANADRMHEALRRRRSVATPTRTRPERPSGLPTRPRRARGARRVRLASDRNAPSPNESNVARLPM